LHFQADRMNYTSGVPANVAEMLACFAHPIPAEEGLGVRAGGWYNLPAMKSELKYHIWTEGCQMNVADSRRVASALERLGYHGTTRPEEADVIVLNTCVVRQSAEDKAVGRLNSLKPLKKRNPNLVINLMGCLVGVKGHDKLRQRFPFVDVFSPPSDPGPLIALLTQEEARTLEDEATRTRFALMDGDLLLPQGERGTLVSAFIPVVYGCSHACTYCIIPYKRGIERSRPVGEIIAEARALARQGVQEITLLGQIVDRYGKDIPDGPKLWNLLRILHDEVEGIQRIRFLTSHPNWMTDELLEAVAELPRVMPHIEVPVQAGNDQVLANMRREYTADTYRRLVRKIRARIPNVSIATDIIVGFPGETEAEFEDLLGFVAEARLERLGAFLYSPEEGTPAARLPDPVPEERARERLDRLMGLQARISYERNRALVGRRLRVLVDECEDGVALARSAADAPEVDAAVILRGAYRPGDFLEARITGAQDYDLEAEAVEPGKAAAEGAPRA